jgi:metal-responsive CopG/Arc/MetJ family transcriptional regulator
MEEIDEIVNGQKSGYRSRSDFVVDAIRGRLGRDREIDQLRSQVQDLAEFVQRISTGEITITPKSSQAEAATKRVKR